MKSTHHHKPLHDFCIAVALLMALTAAPGAPAATKTGPAITLNYATDNEAILAKHLRPGDRLAFTRQQVLDSRVWPAKAAALKQKTRAGLLVTWPSWRLAQTSADCFAPQADVFGYDIESDSPPDEIRNTTQTMNDVRAFLTTLAQKHHHPVKFSCGLNHNFGVAHLKDLVQADDVHIHCNGMLRDYPAKDRRGQHYVEWAVATAQAARRINPKVGLWFGIHVPGLTADKSIEVARRITEEMHRLTMAFDGFTLWSVERRGSDPQTLNEILERIRPSLPPLVPQSKAFPKLGVNYVYHGMEQFIAARGGTREDFIARQNEKLQRLGPVWVRSAGKGDLTGLHWAYIEPQEGVFDFTLHDARVRDAQRRGLFMLGNVDFSDPPEYASLRGQYFDDARYLEFLRAVIERYDGDGEDDMPGLERPIRFWEIGNEPAGRHMFRGTPQQYAHVLKISYETIHSNDPGATVLIGGLAIGALREEHIWKRALDYLDHVLAADGGRSFDIMNYHEYTDDCDFLTYHHVQGFKQLLKQHGFEKPFWVTESNTKLQKEGKGKYEGVSVRHSLERQAQDVIKRAIVAFDAGVDVFFWHRIDDIRNESLRVGLFDNRDQPKPVFYNLQLLANRLAGFRSIHRIKLKPDNLYFYKLETGAGTEFVLWTESEDTALDVGNHVNTSEVEMTLAITEAGRPQPVTKTANKTSVPATRTPAFVRPIK